MEYLNKDEYYAFLKNAKSKIKNGNSTWVKLAEEFNKKFNDNITSDTLRLRSKRYVSALANGRDFKELKSNQKQDDSTKEFETKFSDGTVEARKVVKYSKAIFGDNDKLLEYLGYDKTQWEFVYVTTSSWEQSSKKDGLKNLYAVKFKLKPKSIPSITDMVEDIKKVLAKEIKPLVQTSTIANVTKLNDKLLMEIPAIELHLGKLSNAVETGENYDVKIARLRFEHILQKIIDKQKEANCGTCLLVIGNDFFNSESDNMTTNKTPQQNDTRYKKLFLVGLELYVKTLYTLKKYFKRVDVMLCSGNHARAMEFFLYIALKEHFATDEVIRFSEDFKDTQYYKFGQCGIFFNHGDANLAKTIKSIPSEFFDVWGRTLYRELHLGHLHKEVTVDDESGMITRRIGSPCATDNWHYQNRFVGATKKHQIFLWDKENGLVNIHYIPNKD